MKRTSIMFAIAVMVVLSFFYGGTAQAAPQSANGPAVATKSTAAQAFDANCGGLFDPCGIVNNRTSRYLQVARDSMSSLYCDVPAESSSHPRGWVAPGRNSNQSPPGFKDTDCFRSTECSVFYAGLWHPPYDWVRIRNSVFIYSLGC